MGVLPKANGVVKTMLSLPPVSVPEPDCSIIGTPPKETIIALPAKVELEPTTSRFPEFIFIPELVVML